MKVEWFRRAFTVRSHRLLIWFLFSLGFNLIVALKAPLWALLLGPLFLGIPHLAASLRYLPRLLGESVRLPREAVFISIGTLFVLMATIRVGLGDSLTLGCHWPNSIELFGALLGFLLLVLLVRPERKSVALGSVMITSLALGSFFYPLETLGVMILGHNFVAFAFWIARSKSPADRKTAIFCGTLFVLATSVLLVGGLDGFALSRPLTILNESFDEITVGASIFPYSADLWTRAVSAYAFGQGVHYFVWLKAIPELELSQQTSTTFVQSARLFIQDMGRPFVFGVSSLSVGILALGLWISLAEVRTFYLTLAAFHGYFEWVSLAFVRKGLPS